MKKFSSVSSHPFNLMVDNIDTDMIIPKQFLKTITRLGLGTKLFFEMRYDDTGVQKADFLMQHGQKILLAGDNFGCGSSREHAVWALADFGFECVIAPAFADIFYNNCFENGILPIALPKESIAKLMNTDGEIAVDLPSQTIKRGGLSINFEIEPFKKKRLIEGLDSIGMTLVHENEISQFEAKQKEQFPWL